MDELTIIISDLAKSPDHVYFPCKKEFEPILKEANIDDHFTSYLLIGESGNLTGIMGNLYLGPREINHITPEFSTWAEQMRARWSIWEYIKTICAQKKRGPSKSVPTSAEEQYIADFKNLIQEMRPNPEETVLLMDVGVSDKYLSALDEMGINYKTYLKQ